MTRNSSSVVTTTMMMRGPLMLSVVAVSILGPWMATWSTHSMMLLCLAAMGIVVWILDVLRWTKSSIRDRAATFLEEFVLDDFLRRLHDPETGVIPCAVGSFMGASSMYGLRLDNEQKTRLLQASLWTGKEEARSILLDAGGTKALLPESIQQWLGEGRMTKNEPPPTTMTTTSLDKRVVEPVLVETVEEDMESHSSDSDSHDHPNGGASPRPASPECTSTPKRRGGRRRCAQPASSMPDARPHEVAFPRQQQEQPGIMIPPPDIPTDPMLEMLKIVRDMTLDKLRPLFASIPETKMEILGTVAALGLCAQMVVRARSKRSLSGTVIAMGLSGTAAGAFMTVLLRQAMLGSIRDVSSLQLISSMVLSRSLQRIKNLITKDKRMSATVALLILALVGRKTPPKSASLGLRKQYQSPS